jgi:hypothetical protein
MAVNWYRFKIELIVWAVKLCLCVFTGLCLIAVYQKVSDVDPDILYLNGAEQLTDQHLWIMPAATVGVLVFMWAMFLAAFRGMRSGRRYNAS